MKNYIKFYLFLNLTQLRCFLLFISKTKLMDEIAEEPHYEFSFFETCQLTWKKEQQEELCCCCCYIGNRNYKEGAALSYESVYPLITILYVVSLWLKRKRNFSSLSLIIIPQREVLKHRSWIGRDQNSSFSRQYSRVLLPWCHRNPFQLYFSF